MKFLYPYQYNLLHVRSFRTQLFVFFDTGLEAWHPRKDSLLPFFKNQPQCHLFFEAVLGLLRPPPPIICFFSAADSKPLFFFILCTHLSEHTRSPERFFCFTFFYGMREGRMYSLCKRFRQSQCANINRMKWESPFDDLLSSQLSPENACPQVFLVIIT